MKIVDIEKGEIFGVNGFDLLIVAVSVFIGYLALTTILSNPLVFDGEEVYKAVKVAKKLNSKGFIFEANAKVRQIGDPRNIERTKKGVIVRAYGGTLVLKDKNGNIYTIGGKESYLEEFAADSVVFTPMYNNVLYFHMNQNVTFDDFNSFVEALDKIKSYSGAYMLVVSGDIGISNPEVKFPEFKDAVEDCYLCIDSKAILQDRDYYTIRYTLAELSEIKRLNFKSGYVETDDLKVYLGYKEELPPDKENKIVEFLLNNKFIEDKDEVGYVSVNELF